MKGDFKKLPVSTGSPVKGLKEDEEGFPSLCICCEVGIESAFLFFSSIILRLEQLVKIKEPHKIRGNNFDLVTLNFSFFIIYMREREVL